MVKYFYAMLIGIDEGERRGDYLLKKIWVGLMMVGSLLFGAGSMYVVWQWTEKEPLYVQEEGLQEETERLPLENLEKVSKAYHIIKNAYVEKVEDEKLIEGAIEGMLATLQDPHSVYMDEEMVRQFEESLESTFTGIGAEVTSSDGKIIIVAPIKDSPAEKAGIKPNDEILSVDGESVVGLSLYEATMKIRGEKGTKVTLEIKRAGIQEPFIVEIIRDEISQITVHGEIKEQFQKKIGLIEITTFAEKTAEEFFQKLTEFEKEHIDGLIIDVRGNPGGLLSSVEEILKQFVSKDKPYIQIEKRNGEKIRYFSSLSKRKPYPIAVLIDGGSASASEILAGALKEGEGYTLIGEKTFGKGTVQQAIPLGDGSNIKLTLYKWLTPDGNWVHNKGIEPDIEIKQKDIFYTYPLQLDGALVRDMNNDLIKNAQKMLDGLGFSPRRTDGYFDDQTEKAVMAFQNYHGLPVTGKIDNKTAATLEKATIEEMNKEENDLQLQTALRYLAKQ